MGVGTIAFLPQRPEYEDAGLDRVGRHDRSHIHAGHIVPLVVFEIVDFEIVLEKILVGGQQGG